MYSEYDLCSKFYSMEHDNAIQITKRDPGYTSTLGRSKLQSYFLPFEDQSSPNLVFMHRTDCSLQHCFPVDDMLFHSRDICNQAAKFLTKFYKFGSHAKFGDNRPSDLGDLVPKKRRKASTAKHKRLHSQHSWWTALITYSNTHTTQHMLHSSTLVLWYYLTGRASRQQKTISHIHSFTMQKNI